MKCQISLDSSRTPFALTLMRINLNNPQVGCLCTAIDPWEPALFGDAALALPCINLNTDPVARTKPPVRQNRLHRFDQTPPNHRYLDGKPPSQTAGDWP